MLGGWEHCTMVSLRKAYSLGQREQGEGPRSCLMCSELCLIFPFAPLLGGSFISLFLTMSVLCTITVCISLLHCFILSFKRWDTDDTPFTPTTPQSSPHRLLRFWIWLCFPFHFQSAISQEIRPDFPWRYSYLLVHVG